MALDDDFAGGRVSEEALTRRRADNVPRGINDPERARESRRPRHKRHNAQAAVKGAGARPARLFCCINAVAVVPRTTQHGGLTSTAQATLARAATCGVSCGRFPLRHGSFTAQEP